MRAGKIFELPIKPTSIAPIPLSASSDPLHVGNPSHGDRSNVLRSETLRMDRVSGQTDDEIQMVKTCVSEPEGTRLQHQHDSLLINDPEVSNCWSSLFKNSSLSSRELEHYTRPSDDPDVHVEFDDEDTSAAKLTWGNALVGYFIGKTPPFFTVKYSLEKAWRVTDLEVISMSEDFYLFKFNSYDAGQVILDDGPWFVHGHPLVLRRWTEDIEMCRQMFETIPVWVRFPNLNFCFRTSNAFSKIASVIGRPICMDHATAAGTRFCFC
ncbi:hypothetical protein AAC387_Pa10g0702 [Persea americana]|eukprot:TRINITY_DN12021_c0_g3_i4.p2 TRINITY_DN12021_c0_g3~~TRINITY_DN12021_c0_g3_i4.p2  ORF type:complete len:267 (+),score=46.51 TRINITY_DN12021_c0_g3_i4:323-1123(+)